MKTRIVKETNNGGIEYFYVEDGTPWFWGLFYTWKRPNKYGWVKYENLNCHWSLEAAEKWISARSKWIQDTNQRRYDSQIKSIEIVK